jgi:hypothetical protein
MVTSLRVLKSPPLTAAFAEYVEKALCYESFKFLVEASAYAQAVFESTVLQVDLLRFHMIRIALMHLLLLLLLLLLLYSTASTASVAQC